MTVLDFCDSKKLREKISNPKSIGLLSKKPRISGWVAVFTSQRVRGQKSETLPINFNWKDLFSLNLTSYTTYTCVFPELIPTCTFEFSYRPQWWKIDIALMKLEKMSRIQVNGSENKEEMRKVARTRQSI